MGARARHPPTSPCAHRSMQYVFNKCNKQSTTLLRDNVLIRTSKSLSYPPFDDNIPFCRTSSRMQGLLLLALSFNALPDIFHASSLASQCVVPHLLYDSGFNAFIPHLTPSSFVFDFLPIPLILLKSYSAWPSVHSPDTTHNSTCNAQVEVLASINLGSILSSARIITIVDSFTIGIDATLSFAVGNSLVPMISAD